MTIKFNNIFVYKLPEFKDDEGNDITINISPPEVFEFLSLNIDTITFYPTEWDMVGTHEIRIILSDSILNSLEYKFKVKIENKPPYFE